VRSEIEIGVAPPKAVVDLLAAAGLRPTFRYEKFRSSYRVASFPRLHVELDETPMGTYLELEGPPRAIDQMARKLGFAAKEYITQSYLALYLDECRRKRVPAGDFVFARRKK
jgi:adenylate cyclase class 2